MKKALLLFTWTLILYAFAQAQNAIPIQGVARSSNGVLLSNQFIALRISVLDGGASGSTVFQERDTVTTNNLGLFAIGLGFGQVSSGYTFSGINWGSASKYVKIELDPAGGTSYALMGITQFQNVPYALYAANASGVPKSEIAYGSGNNSLTGDSLFNRDSAQTNIFCQTSNILEGLSIGGSQLGGTLPDGDFLQREDFSEGHVDFLGIGSFVPWGSPHGIGIACIKSDSSNNGPSAVIFLRDSDPVNTLIQMSSSNVSETNFQGVALLSPITAAFGLAYGNSQQWPAYAIAADTLGLYIKSDSATWTWPKYDGLPSQVLSTDGMGNLFWATDTGGTGGASQPAEQVAYGTGGGLTSDHFFLRSAGDGSTIIEAHDSLVSYTLPPQQATSLQLFPGEGQILYFDATNNIGGHLAIGNNLGDPLNPTPFVETCIRNFQDSSVYFGMIAYRDSVQLITAEWTPASGIYGNDGAIVGTQISSCYFDVSFKNGSTLNSLTVDTDGVHWEYLDTDRYVFPLYDGTANQVLTTNGSGSLSWTAPLSAKSKFTPTTGNTITIINPSNLIKPSGSLAALTIALPSSPPDGRIEEFSFTQSISAITWASGTVDPNVLTTVSAGNTVRLQYDAGDTTWYNW